MVTQAATIKPSRNDAVFLQTVHKIKSGQVNRGEIELALSGKWLEAAIGLYEGIQEQGPDGFTKVYHTLKVDNKLLREKEHEILPEPGQEDPHFIVDENGRRSLRLYSIEDIYQTPNAKYLLGKLLEEATISLIFGVSGTGKTFTALDIALSIAHGLRWQGLQTQTGPVWFVNTEGPRGLKKRLMAWYKEHPQLTPSPNFHIIPWSLDLRENIADLLTTLEQHAKAGESPKLIVLDNFSMCVPGADQNSQAEISAVLRSLYEDIIKVYGCHIMLVHHTNKDGDFNGTMAFRNHVDAMLELRKEDKTMKDSPILFTSRKVRDEDDIPDIRIQLKQVTLYFDEDIQENVTSCVVVSCNAPQPEKTTPDIYIKVLEILRAHGQLNCSQWAKSCLEAYQISRPTFYRVRGEVDNQGYIQMVGEKKNGSRVYYRLTELGEILIKPVSPVSNQYQETA